MKTKILYAVTAILILTFSFVVYASLDNSKNNFSGDSCCAMKDCCKDGKCSMSENGKCNSESCSMKKDGKCDKTDCRKDGKCSMSVDGKCNCGGEHKCGEACKDSCPMHKKDGDGQATTKGECCKGKDSCPMKKKDGKTDN